MSEIIENNRRVAKNTLYLYIRMFLMMAISFYTSRVILEQLGIVDFGVYNLVGGVVSLMSFLNSSMAGATSRFLTYDLGKKDIEHLKKTFSSALQIHLAIAIVIFFIGESVGVWFINSQLNIPVLRIKAANIVFQMSLLTSVVTIIQVPYSASLIAHEKMDVYALIEILNACLKLIAVYILLIVNYDKLIFYSILLFFVSVLILLLYRTYCINKFCECHLKKGVIKDVVKPMLSFSGWDLYGNGCVVARQQGTNILLNSFFGVTINAASGVATQVSSAVSLFISNITMSIRPQLIKYYAANNIVGMQKMLSLAIIICIILLQIVMVPVYLNIHTIMHFWLKDVPQYAIEFTKLMLLANAISTANTLFNAIIHATGNIKRLSIIEGTLFLSTLFFTYISLNIVKEPTLAYLIWTIIMAMALIVSMIISKKNIVGLSFKSFFMDVRFPVLATICNILLISILNSFFDEGIHRLLIISVINVITLSFFLYLVWIIPCFKGDIKIMLKSFA